MAFNLIEQLRHYNLDYLMPENIDLSERADEEEIDSDYYSSFSECGPYDNYSYESGAPDPSEEGYYDNYDYHDEKLESELRMIDSEDKDGVIGYVKPVYCIEDLLNVFDADYMSPEEFLSMNIWDLFGISKKQFDMIDWTNIQENNFTNFYDAFIDNSRSFPIEKRIRYATAEATTGYRSIAIYGNDKTTSDELLEYAERIIDKHSFEDMESLIAVSIKS